MANVIVEKEDGFLVEPFCDELHIGPPGFLLPGVTPLEHLENEQVRDLLDQIYG